MSRQPKTIRQKILKYPLKKWPWKSKEKYFKWVKETYGDVAQPESYVEGYRAYKQVLWASEVPITKVPTQIITSAGMVKMAQEILNNSLREAVEEHANNQFGL